MPVAPEHGAREVEEGTVGTLGGASRELVHGEALDLALDAELAEEAGLPDAVLALHEEDAGVRSRSLLPAVLSEVGVLPITLAEVGVGCRGAEGPDRRRIRVHVDPVEAHLGPAGAIGVGRDSVVRARRRGVALQGARRRDEDGELLLPADEARREDVPLARLRRLDGVAPAEPRVEGADHVVRAAEARVGRLLEEPEHDRLEGRRHLDAALADRLDLLGRVRAEHLHGGPPGEGERPGERLVGDDSERVEVGARVEPLAAHDLGRHVSDRPAEAPVERPRELAREVEVHDLDDTGFGGSAPGPPDSGLGGPPDDEDVLGLYVRVEEAARVDVGERAERLDEQVEEQPDGLSPRRLDEVGAVEVFLGEEELLAVGEAVEVVDARHVRVPEPREVHELAPEVGERLRGDAVRAHHLQGDVLVALLVAGEEDAPERARSELAHDLVAGVDRLPREREVVRRDLVVVRAHGAALALFQACCRAWRSGSWR